MMDRIKLREIQDKAEAGDPEAMYKLSEYLRTAVTDRSYAENIFYWLKKSAEGGYAQAQFEYGMALAQANSDECLDYIQKAADQGHETAIVLLDRIKKTLEGK